MGTVAARCRRLATRGALSVGVAPRQVSDHDVTSEHPAQKRRRRSRTRRMRTRALGAIPRKYQPGFKNPSSAVARGVIARWVAPGCRGSPSIEPDQDALWQRFSRPGRAPTRGASPRPLDLLARTRWTRLEPDEAGQARRALCGEEGGFRLPKFGRVSSWHVRGVSATQWPPTPALVLHSVRRRGREPTLYSGMGGGGMSTR